MFYKKPWNVIKGGRQSVFEIRLKKFIAGEIEKINCKNVTRDTQAIVFAVG